MGILKIQVFTSRYFSWCPTTLCNRKETLIKFDRHGQRWRYEANIDVDNIDKVGQIHLSQGRRVKHTRLPASN